MKIQSDPRQLSFDFKRCEVIPFPLDRRANLRREVARELLALPTFAERSHHWRWRTFDIADDLREIGIPEPAIAAQLARFHTAVGCEGRRQVHLAIVRGDVAV